MEAHVLVQTYDTYGGHSSISIIGELLEVAARNVDGGVAAFEATVCFRTNLPSSRSLKELQSEFHAELDRLPRIRWEGKRRRLSVRYETRLGLVENVLEGPPSRTLLQSAVAELVALMNANRESLSRKPGFNAGTFFAMIESLADLIPLTDADVAAFHNAEAARRRAERSLLPWWEQLGIEWGEYHPAARELLFDPFFWSEVDDYSPHGNDTGADLLSDFRTWRRTHRASPPMEFFQWTLQGWDVPTNWASQPLEEWDSSVEVAMLAHDEAAVALAFALIKLEGSCDRIVRAAALEAIRRQGDPRVAAHFGWDVTLERAAALETLRKVLEALNDGR